MALFLSGQSVHSVKLNFMKWQDIVISICQIFFVVAMIPSIRSSDKPALTTSVMNVILVSIITVCLFTLKLWFSSFTAAMVGLTWSVLAIQKHKINKHAS